MSESRALCAAFSQFAIACNLVSVYYMTTLHEYTPGWFFPQALLLYAPGIYLLNRLFLRRERTMRDLYLLNIAAGAVFVVGYLCFERWKGLSYLVFATIFVAWLSTRGSRLALKGPELRGILLTLDTSFLLLIFLGAYASLTSLELVWGAPAVCGFAAAVISTAFCRSNRPLGWKAWLIMGAAFALLFLATWLVLSVAADPAGQGLVMAWEFLVSVAKTVRDALLRILLALLSLFPDVEPDELPQYDIPDLTAEALPAIESNPVLSMLLSGGLLILLAALVIWGFRQLAKIKLGGLTAMKTTSAGKRTRPSFRQGLYSLLAGWFGRIKLRMFLWKNRNTPKGLYFLLVHRCRRGPWHKRPGETPREFLCRLALCAQDDPPLAAALVELTQAVDMALYSGHPVPHQLEASGMIRHKIGAAVRRQFLRDLLTCLHAKAHPQKNAPTQKA